MFVHSELGRQLVQMVGHCISNLKSNKKEFSLASLNIERSWAFANIQMSALTFCSSANVLNFALILMLCPFDPS